MMFDICLFLQKKKRTITTSKTLCSKFIEENDYKKKERISYIIGVEIDDPKLLIENNTIYVK